MKREMWTALPGEVVEYFSATQTASVRTTIKVKISAPDGSFEWVEVPMLVDCPVLFPSGGGYTLTFPVVPGDECLVVFSSRCIDGWWQSSGAQIPPDTRLHDLSDGFVLLGPRSQPRRTTPAPSTSGVELRSDDRSVYIRIANADKKVEVVTTGPASVTAGGTIALNAPTVAITGDLTVTGTVVAQGQVTGLGKNLSTHVHSGVTAGGSNTGAPV